MLLTSTDGASVELRPTRYELSVAPPVHDEVDVWDAGWLQVEGAVRTASGESWTFDDPCLTTWEARDLGTWLSDAAAAWREELAPFRDRSADPRA